MAHHLLANRFGSSFIMEYWINHTHITKTLPDTPTHTFITMRSKYKRKKKKQKNSEYLTARWMRWVSGFYWNKSFGSYQRLNNIQGLRSFSFCRRNFYLYFWYASIKLMIWRERCLKSTNLISLKVHRFEVPTTNVMWCVCDTIRKDTIRWKMNMSMTDANVDLLILWHFAKQLHWTTFVD